MAQIRWTREAELWLKDIYDYIAEDNPDAAETVVFGIYEKAQVILDHPDIGYVYKESEQGLVRVVLYGHYRIAYIQKNDYFDILGVFHGALDIDRYMGA